jgi:hypothetical protein
MSPAVEGGTLADYSDMYQLRSVDLAPEDRTTWGMPVVQALMALNKPSIVTPIIAWLCAAPLRSTVDEFPPLAVRGGSGSGKTTMLKWMPRAFYGIREEHNISAASTPYGLTSWATGTNALPVWYDEYRTQTRRDTMDAANQMLRDAWTASASSRGGMGEDKSKVRDIRITAPIIISRESAFMETSHIDRLVILNLPTGNLENRVLLIPHRRR